MSENKKIVDLVGEGGDQTASGVEVQTIIPFQAIYIYVHSSNEQVTAKTFVRQTSLHNQK